MDIFAQKIKVLQGTVSNPSQIIRRGQRVCLIWWFLSGQKQEARNHSLAAGFLLCFLIVNATSSKALRFDGYSSTTISKRTRMLALAASE